MLHLLNLVARSRPLDALARHPWSNDGVKSVSA